MKRKLTCESKEPRKREKLADVVIPTIQERVMENDDITGIIGSFLESRDKTAYCQTARINLADGPFVHPSKVDMSFCLLMGCRLTCPETKLLLCNTHLCSTFRGKVESTGKPIMLIDPQSRHLQSAVVDFGKKSFVWNNTLDGTTGYLVPNKDHFRKIWDLYTKWMYLEDKERSAWVADLQPRLSPLLRRFIKNRRRFKPGTLSLSELKLEYDQLGMTRRDEDNSN